MKFKNENGNVKIIIAVIILLLAIIVGIVIFKMSGKDRTVAVIEEEPYEYFAMYSLDQKVGIVDKKGKTLIKPEYTTIYIPNQSKEVFFCFKGDEYQILDSKGKDIFEEFSSVSPITISDTSLEMEKNVLCYEEKGKYGLVDYDGKKLTGAIYDKVESLKNKPGCILVKKDGLYGVLDSYGNVVVDIKYNSVKSDEFCSETEGYLRTGYIVTEKTSTGIIYGYIDYNGEKLVEPEYESITRALEYQNEDDVYLVFMERGKKGVIKNKKVIIKPRYQTINYYDQSDVFIVNKNGKYGFYDNEGDEILAPEFVSYSIAGNYVSVKKGDDMMLYDLHGNLVNSNNYKSISETGNPAYFIAQDEQGYYSIISKDAEIKNNYTNITYAFDNFFVFTTKEGFSGVLDLYSGTEIEAEYDYIIVLENSKALEARKGTIVDIYSKNIEKVLTMENGIVESVNKDYIAVYSDKQLEYINSNGEIVQNTEVFKDLKLYSYQAEDGKWGYKDANGTLIVDCRYDLVTELNQYGYAGIYQEGKWGVIDASGKVVVVPSYEIDTYYMPSFMDKYLLQEQYGAQCIEIEEN
ncbi:MAG: WG repeat-containing protein [Clostridia bacterium]|nr:WG repeat-containing protein [Clostridia bacterium]